MISLGDEYKNVVICRTIGIISKDIISTTIHEGWAKSIGKNSVKIGKFYVGRSLVNSLKNKEKRFATDLSSPIESDLIYV